MTELSKQNTGPQATIRLPWYVQTLVIGWTAGWPVVCLINHADAFAREASFFELLGFSAWCVLVIFVVAWMCSALLRWRLLTSFMAAYCLCWVPLSGVVHRMGELIEHPHWFDSALSATVLIWSLSCLAMLEMLYRKAEQLDKSVDQ